MSPPTPAIALATASVGANPTRLWGLTMAERTARIARTAGFATDAPGARLLTHNDYAWDPAWLRHLAANPGMVVTLGGVAVLGHARDAGEAAALLAAMEGAAALDPATTLDVVTYESGPTIENKALRKRETPFLGPLQPATVRSLERASYFGAYKGVTDLLTKYLWPEWALVLTRIAARCGISPNQVTFVGGALCIVATVLFAFGHYWLGMVAGLGFMVLDTVDGKLARCTITSSNWGNVADHGLDLVHPPFWWWFWATGLSYWGLAYDSATFWLVQGAIQGGYLLQRGIEGVFLAQFGLDAHVWQRFDSRFRLIAARRNPNMVILFGSMLLARPDWGLIAVAVWTVLSCALHAVRLVQAIVAPKPLTSWLSEEAP